VRVNTNARRKHTLAKLQNKAYRDAFVAEQINTVLPFQIRAMRGDREWTQRELGERAEMKQEMISLLESLSYGRYTLRTLTRLASAFDVGLVVRFVSFSELINWATNLSPEHVSVPSFDNDPGLKESSIPCQMVNDRLEY
jgi:transcriptional regulator with XRE-family HTH domain